MNGLRIASFLFVIVGGAVSYTGQIIDEVSPKYQNHLNILKLTMALNIDWSPVWSEKLKPVSDLSQPNPSFCTQLILKENNTAPIETYKMIDAIVSKCSFSGMYLSYGLKLLSHSIMCFFQKHALVHLETVDIFLGNKTDRFQTYLQQILKDYETIAAKLAAVGASLKNLVQLVSFLHEVQTEMTTDGKSKRESLRKNCKKKRKLLTAEHQKYCAVSTSVWYDRPNMKLVELNVTKEATDKKIPSDQVLSKAEELRLIMINVFNEMHFREMPEDIWKIIFSDNIYVKKSDFQINDVESTENITGTDFPWSTDDMGNELE